MPYRRPSQNTSSTRQDQVFGIPERQRTPYTCNTTTLASRIDDAGVREDQHAAIDTNPVVSGEELPSYETVLEEIVSEAQQEPQQEPQQERQSINPPVVPAYYDNHSTSVDHETETILSSVSEATLPTPQRQSSRHWGQGHTFRPNFQSMSPMIPPLLRIYIDIAFTPVNSRGGVTEDVRLVAREILKELVDMRRHEMCELRHEIRNRVAEERERQITS